MDAPRLPQGHAASPVAVGLSGGLDSSVLLHLLAGSPDIRANGLRAIHIHHGLHRDADAWAAHCQALCAARGVACEILRVAVDRGTGLGLEAAARAARQRAFAAALGEGGVLALAHHRDDQAETFLLRALRASGPDGLAAMRPWRPFAPGWLWRPLLGFPRDDLLAYARAHRLEWIDDDSNRDTALDRNFLRRRVLPLLAERWPRAVEAFAGAARLQGEAVELLDAGDALALAAVRTVDARVLRRDALRALPEARRARVLRRWIASLGLPPLPAQGVARIESDLLDAAPDADAEFAWGSAVVHAWRGLLHADERRAPLPMDWEAEWALDAAVALPTGDRLDFRRSGPGREPELAVAAEAAATHSLPLRVHARRGGERIVLPGRSHSHALKHVLQDLGVPPWERAALPLLSDADGRLLAAGDLVYSAEFDAWLRALGARLHWIRPQERLPGASVLPETP